jgi:hypothetical protein
MNRAYRLHAILRSWLALTMPKNEAKESETCICWNGRNNQLEISEFIMYIGTRHKY